ncbi:hypothetical protein [Acinetobacter sp.]|uniref:hypothetical protein n=1 Tax=Acinetobacter sp. TaxID=472 RepID=UPI00258A6CA1|nr:hypothetical protein [Acinetobacter sp.]
MAGVTSLGVATASLASGDQNLKQAYDTVMNPARTFDFVQKHPEAATVLEQFKNGDYDGLLATKGSIQLLAQALGQDVNVLTTSITSFLNIKGANDHQTATVVLDVNNENRSSILNTTGHEIAHGQGIKNETSADLVGKSVDWAFNSGVKNNQGTIDQFKGQLGDGKDASTQAQNIAELAKDNTIVVGAISDHGEKIDEKTSYWQDIKHLGCWSDECVTAYKQMDAAQEKAYRLGQSKATTKFINDIKNLPNVPKEVYEALTKDPMGTMSAIWEGVKNIPGELWDTGKTITKGNLVGSSPAEFEKMGNAEMTTALNGLSAAISAGTVTVVKKGATITVEAVKNINKVPKIYVNNVGIKEVKITSTPLEGHAKLNKPDQGKLKPAEAAAGAQLESVLGQMEKYNGTTTTKNPDWKITSGPNKGKTVDAMYTTDKLNQKEIDGLNKFYEKNMTKGSEKDKIQDHLGKADFVPIDFRVLNPSNQEVFLNYVKTLPKSQQNQFIIMR